VDRILDKNVDQNMDKMWIKSGKMVTMEKMDG
jgi:hypothetical protein